VLLYTHLAQEAGLAGGAGETEFRVAHALTVAPDSPTARAAPGASANDRDRGARTAAGYALPDGGVAPSIVPVVRALTAGLPGRHRALRAAVLELARVLEARCPDWERAFEQYLVALQIDPEDEAAREAAWRLAEAHAAWPIVARVLELKAKDTEETWLSIALLHDVARIQEIKLNQPERAFETLRRAFALELDEELARLVPRGDQRQRARDERGQHRRRARDRHDGAVLGGPRSDELAAGIRDERRAGVGDEGEVGPAPIRFIATTENV
jgi:tetratricopeptide (TPR) repeat protein